MQGREKTVCSETVSHHQDKSGSRGCQQCGMGRHPMDKRGREVDVKNRQEEDNVHC